jgi:hypothetical protein
MPARKPRFRNVGAGKGVKELLDPDALARLYVEEQLPQAEIARRYGCSVQFVSQLVHEYGIARPRKHATRDRAG